MAFVVPANARSRAVMTRLGMSFTHDDDFAHPSEPVGHPLRPHLLYRLRREEFRAIATRYDKTAGNFLAGVDLAAAAIWLN